MIDINEAIMTWGHKVLADQVITMYDCEGKHHRDKEQVSAQRKIFACINIDTPKNAWVLD